MKGMRRQTRAWLAGAAVVMLGFTVTGTNPLSAQTLEGGMKGGMTFANLTGDDAEEANARVRTGYTAGGFLTFRFNRLFALQPEVSYVQKGAKLTFDEIEGDVDGKARIGYIEVPILFKAMTQLDNGWNPIFALLAGPMVAFKTGCEMETRVEGVTVTLDCDDPELDAAIKSTDFGLAFGAGMGVPIGRAHLWLDGRYVLGLTDIDDDAEEDLDLRNYHFAVTAGLSVPLWSGPRALASLR